MNKLIEKYWWAIALLFVVILWAVWYFFIAEDDTAGDYDSGDGDKDEKASYTTDKSTDGKGAGKAELADSAFALIKLWKTDITAYQKASGDTGNHAMGDFGIGMLHSTWDWDVLCSFDSKILGEKTCDPSFGKDVYPLVAHALVNWCYSLNCNCGSLMSLAQKNMTLQKDCLAFVAAFKDGKYPDVLDPMTMNGLDLQMAAKYPVGYRL